MVPFNDCSCICAWGLAGLEKQTVHFTALQGESSVLLYQNNQK